MEWAVGVEVERKEWGVGCGQSAPETWSGRKVSPLAARDVLFRASIIHLPTENPW